ncbi:MAG: PDZ domain-containing protein, partial [Actinomycetota bacterium]
MVSSKQIAEFVALTRLGIESEFAYGDVIVDEVVCEDLPDSQSACRLLQPGDVIVTFNGKPTPTLPSLIEAVAASKSGDLAEVGVRREGSETEQTIAIAFCGIAPTAPTVSSPLMVPVAATFTLPVSEPFDSSSSNAKVNAKPADGPPMESVSIPTSKGVFTVRVSR